MKERRNVKCALIVAVAMLLVGLSVQGQIPRWDIKLTPAEHGSLTVYKFYAAEDWRYPERRNELDTPNRGPDWPLLCDTNGTAAGLQVLYWREVNGVARFTNGSGAPRQAPQRWAYARLRDDLWTGVSHKPGNDGATAEKAPDLDGTMRWLATFGFSKKAVMDAMDKVSWTDATGAPEGG